MIGDDVISKKAFTEFGDRAVRAISLRNAQLPVTEVSEVLEM
jgi:hypothetical protein